MTSYTTNKNFIKPANGENINTWDTPVNTDWDSIDNAFAGSYPVTGLTNTNVALTQANVQAARITLAGTLTGAVIITIPSGISGSWVVVNNTSGLYTVTFQNSASSSFTPLGNAAVVPQSYSSYIYSDGSNVSFADSRLQQLPVGGSTDQIFYLNGQTVTTNYTIPTGQNAMTAGPVTINSAATVTINGSSRWAIV